MRPLVRLLLATAAAALLAGCVSQHGAGTTKQASQAEPPAGSSKVDAEVRRIFAVAGLDPNDPQKARAVDRQAVGTVLAVRSGGRKVGMAVARLGRDQLLLQDPEAVARLVPGADEQRLSRALSGPIPTAGSISGARVAFDRRHLALEIEADGSVHRTTAAADRFVPSMRIGEPVPADVVASVRAGRDPASVLGAPPDDAPAAAQPLTPSATPAVAERNLFASLFQARAPSPAAAVAQPEAPIYQQQPARPPEPPLAPETLRPPPAAGIRGGGPAIVTVADDVYSGGQATRKPPAAALGYAPPPPIAYGDAMPEDPPSAPSVRRW